MSNAVPAYGTLLKRGSTAVAEVISIQGPGLSGDTADVSNLTSPSSFKEYMKAFTDGGEITFDLNWQPGLAGHITVLGDATAAAGTAAQAYTVDWTGAGTHTWVANCFVTKFSPSADKDKQLMASVTLKVTGLPTIT